MSRRPPEPIFLIIIFLLCIFPRFTQGFAQDREQKKPWFETISVNTFLSAGYVYNGNRPDSQQNLYRVFDSKDNTITIDVMELSMKKDAVESGQAGFRFDLTAGSSIPHVTRSGGLDIGDLDFHQMFLSYVAPLWDGLKLDIGKFVTPAGYEVIEGYDSYNDNYSRSLLFGYAIPFTHTGVKASYSFSGNVSAMLMLVNGWDDAVDNNKSKSIGAGVSLVPAHGVSVSVNAIVGPEKEGNNSDNRSLLDIVGMYTITNEVILGVNGDYGREQHSAAGGGDAAWDGIAGYLRLNLQENISVSLRGEQFEDRDGIRTGTSQSLREFTLTPEYRPAEHFVLRGEIRFDRSTQDVFPKESNWADTQTTVGINLLYAL